METREFRRFCYEVTGRGHPLVTLREIVCNLLGHPVQPGILPLFQVVLPLKAEKILYLCSRQILDFAGVKPKKVQSFMITCSCRFGDCFS